MGSHSGRLFRWVPQHWLKSRVPETVKADLLHTRSGRHNPKARCAFGQALVLGLDEAEGDCSSMCTKETQTAKAVMEHLRVIAL